MLYSVNLTIPSPKPPYISDKYTVYETGSYPSQIATWLSLSPKHKALPGPQVTTNPAKVPLDSIACEVEEYTGKPYLDNVSSHS